MIYYIIMNAVCDTGSRVSRRNGPLDTVSMLPVAWTQPDTKLKPGCVAVLVCLVAVLDPPLHVHGRPGF